MSSYRVEFTKSAAREFSRLAKSLQAKISEALEVLVRNPYSDLLRVKRLRGAEALYRIRIGDYRVIYDIRPSILTVVVIKVGHRGEVYRRLQ